MRAKSLQDNAPGETRTPNLLIRSQFSRFGFRASTRQSAQEGDEELPKTDSGFHNNSHNGPPDLYANSLIFTAWRFGA